MTKANVRVVVLSDVDCALSDPGGRGFADARIALARLARNGVHLVLCSSRTRAEIEAIQHELDVHEPFVSETGGAAFIPAGYFGFRVSGARDVAGYQAVEFGRPYAEVAQVLQDTANRTGIPIVRFGDMSVEEVAGDCGLPLLQARLAKLREYTERFRVLDPSEHARTRLSKALKSMRLCCVMGRRYDQVGGSLDDHLGVNLIRSLYSRAYGPVLTVGLTDAMPDVNDGRSLHHGAGLSDVERPIRGLDAAGWAGTIVDIVEDLRRHASSVFATIRGSYR